MLIMLISSIILVLFVSELFFLNNSAKTEGTVISINTRTGQTQSGGSFPCSLNIQFETEDMQIIKFKTLGEMDPCIKGVSKEIYNVGDPIEVYFDPNKPNNAQIVDFLSNWGPTLTAVVFGIPFIVCLIVALLILSMRNRSK